MRVLMCGDRNWTEHKPIREAFDRLDVTLLIEGGAKGADNIAQMVARSREIPVRTFEADWDIYGKAAGPIRNQQMLDEGKPELVVAFHDDIANSKGTKDMVGRAKKAGVPVLMYQDILELTGPRIIEFGNSGS